MASFNREYSPGAKEARIGGAFVSRRRPDCAKRIQRHSRREDRGDAEREESLQLAGRRDVIVHVGQPGDNKLPRPVDDRRARGNENA